jgi:hypothetical protein
MQPGRSSTRKTDTQLFMNPGFDGRTLLPQMARAATRCPMECHCFGASMRERACASVRTRAMPRPLQSELFSISSRSIAA